MQIERTGSPSVTTVGKSAPANTPSPASTSSASTSSTTGSPPQAQPLSGGRRATSPGIFDQVEIDTHLGPPDLADIVAQKTKELATALTAAFESAKISTAEPIVLTLDSSGAITASGPLKARVEKFFENNPDLAKQFKEVVALNTLLALNMAMRHFTEARKHAKTEEEHRKVEADYISDTMAIQSLGNTMVLADGELTSAAVNYLSVRYGET